MSLPTTVSNLIEGQFPAYYRDEGPLFVEFVRQYYLWMEGQQERSTGKLLRTTLSLNRDNVEVLASNGALTTHFANGEQIALYRGTSNTDYDVATINVVTNTSHLTLANTPGFTRSNAAYGTVTTVDNPLYVSRRILDYVNVDRTIDDFLVHFKNEYLYGVQLETESDTRLLVKNSLDLFRAKGSERAVDLAFRSIFGKPAEVYYPSTDIFRLSAASWIRPTFLEVTFEHDFNSVFVGKQIVGVDSGATAVVERLVRRITDAGIIEVFYLSNQAGTFLRNELINLSIDPIRNNFCPRVVGSMTALDVIDGGTGFAVGDIVEVSSPTGHGSGGLARVAGITNTVGVVDFDFLEEGFGFTNTSRVIVSKYVLELGNVVVNSTANVYMNLFETINQPISIYPYTDANGTFTANALVRTYHANNLLKGQGRILSVAETNSIAGNLTISLISGNLDAGSIYTLANAIGANVYANIGYQQTTHVGNVMGVSANVTLSYNAANGSYAIGDSVLQKNSTGYEVANGTVLLVDDSGSTGNLVVVNTRGVFRPNANIAKRTTNTSANVTSVSVRVGVVPANTVELNFATPSGFTAFDQIVQPETTAYGQVLRGSNSTHLYVSMSSDVFAFQPNTPGIYTGYIQKMDNASVNGYIANIVIEAQSSAFVNTAGNYAYTGVGNTTSTVLSRSLGSGAAADLSNTFLYQETLLYSPDLLSDYLGVDLNASTYGFPNDLTANLTNAHIQDKVNRTGALRTQEIVVGRPTRLINTRRGTDYNVDPFVLVYEELSDVYLPAFGFRRDVTLDITNASASFQVGELVTQNTTHAKGIVETGSNTSVLYLKRLSIVNNFVANSNNNYKVFGQLSGANAKVGMYTQREDTLLMGRNANVLADVITGTGSVTDLEVIGSGHGFTDTENLDFGLANDVFGLGVLGTARATIGGAGISTGRYESQDGFLSNVKKLHDGKYYQAYSYEIRSPITLERYEKMLRQLLHVAGTRYHAAFVYSAQANVDVDVSTEMAVS